jgi:predicted RNase H-like nuclease (RuvC/YqgF family)
MLLAAIIDWAHAIPIIIGILGIAGIIFTALKYNRDDTTAVITQQSTIVGEMKTLNDELRTTTTDLRGERDQLRAQVEELTKQIEALREELGRI